MSFKGYSWYRNYSRHLVFPEQALASQMFCTYYILSETMATGNTWSRIQSFWNHVQILFCWNILNVLQQSISLRFSTLFCTGYTSPLNKFTYPPIKHSAVVNLNFGTSVILLLMCKGSKLESEPPYLYSCTTSPQPWFKTNVILFISRYLLQLLCILTSSWVLVKCVSSPALGCLCKYTDI